MKLLQLDLEGILLGATIAEQVALFAQEGEPAEVLYRLLDATVEALEAGRDRDLVARYFESWLLRTAGIFPPPDDCPQCGRELEGGATLLASGEGLICRDCARAPTAATAVSAGAVDFWRRIGRENIERDGRRPADAGGARRGGDGGRAGSAATSCSTKSAVSWSWSARSPRSSS